MTMSTMVADHETRGDLGEPTPADSTRSDGEHGQDDNESQSGESESDDAPEQPENHSSEFVTMSGVISHLNAQLADLDPGGEKKKFFELHKKLPDGSTMPAREDDIAASDLQTKLQQAVTLIAQMESAEERRQWAIDQRRLGNELFALKEYLKAMDIYVTCLVVYDKNNTKNDRSEQTGETLEEKEEYDALHELMLPVLSNLAQCALNLSMYKKCINFCTIALNESPGKTIFTTKIMYKRGKAHRLIGDYGASRRDLMDALEVLKHMGESSEKDAFTASSDSNESETSIYTRVIQKELRLVYTAEKEAAKNRLRQKKAMKKLLVKKANDDSVAEAVKPKTPQNGDENASLDEVASPGPRKFSRLKAPRETPDPKLEDNEKPFSYTQYYWDMVGRVADTLLEWLGDPKKDD